jgi:hypothetical protein
MNDFAIARTGVHAEMALAFEDDHVPAAARQRLGRRKTDDSGADHDALDVVQRAAYPRGLIEAAAAMKSSTSAFEVAKQVTKRMVTPDAAACSGQR